MLYSHFKLITNGGAGCSSPELQAQLAVPHPASKHSPAAHHAWTAAVTAGPSEAGVRGTWGRQRAATHVGVDSTSTPTRQFL